MVGAGGGGAWDYDMPLGGSGLKWQDGSDQQLAIVVAGGGRWLGAVGGNDGGEKP